MIRFTQPIPDPSYGIPYVNTDFTTVLQDEHLKSYRSVLDGMNYNSYTGSNSGIILKGCKILSTGPSQYQMGFTSSIVYIDGEFYENDPGLTGTVTINSTDFYLIPGPTVSELRLTRDFSTNATFSNTRYFTYSTTLPFVWTPHIRFSNQGTSRYYKTVLKYFSSREGDVYLARTASKFDSNGIGFNEMTGFALLQNNTNITKYTDLRGKFLRGAASNPGTGTIVEGTKTYPVTNTVPYPRIGSGGGTHSHILTKSENATHQHETLTAKWSCNWNIPTAPVYDACFSHYHMFNSTLFQYQSDGTTPNNDPISSFACSSFGYVNEFSDSSTGAINTSSHEAGLFTGGIYDYANSELATHRHAIIATFGTGVVGQDGSIHENRPPYTVLAYYTKIQIT